MRRFDLQSLGKGLPAITPAFGACLAEAGAVCLEDQHHSQGVELVVQGTFHDSFKVYWKKVNDQMLRCWNDYEVTTEHGAYGIAILLIRAHADQTVVKRARKGPGFDYWLGQSDDPLFQNKARLEVSGIRKGSPRAVTRRMNQKLRQIRESDRELPAYVVIVEFSQPLSRMALKEEKQ